MSIKKLTKSFALIFPLTLCLYFLGYCHPKFDIELYTDNIEGEGLAYTYLSPNDACSSLYKAYFYFGSQLKHTTIKGCHYDLEELNISVSDVTEAEFDYFDVRILGIKINHFEYEKIVPPGNYGIFEVKLSDDGNRTHFTFENPSVSNEFSINVNFLPKWFWIIYWSIFALFTIFFSIGIAFILDKFPEFTFAVIRISALALVFFLGNWICGSLGYCDYLYFLLNILILFAFSMAINAITLSTVGTIVTMVGVLVWYCANYFVIIYRGKPVMPSDLLALGTVREVIDKYSLTLNYKIIISFIIISLYSIFVIYIRLSAKKNKSNVNEWVKRFVTIVVSLCLLFGIINTPIFLSVNTFQSEPMLMKGFHEEGMVVSFLRNCIKSRVEPPEGYSQDSVDKYLLEYQEVIEEPIGIQPTNIIMILNESFADLRTVGINKNINVMPFIDSLVENSIVGTLYVSVFGGGTANTEFEALTGNSMAFLNSGTYPYLEIVNKPLFSLASYFKRLGYGTEAFHDNKSTNWFRNVVYPFLGFDIFHSMENYPEEFEAMMLHAEPSDLGDYYYIENVKKDYKGNKSFLFSVTMQNHAPYDRWEDLVEASSVKEIGKDLVFDTKVYLSLIKASDDAVKQLIYTYKNSDEPTMIIFFGDHQPGLSASAQAQLYEDNGDADKYHSKFFIWTNYENESQQNVCISANYLPWLVFKRGNFKMPPYIKLLEEIHEYYPVITAQRIMDDKGNTLTGEHIFDNNPLLQKYRNVQYANLFDEIDQAWFSIE